MGFSFLLFSFLFFSTIYVDRVGMRITSLNVAVRISFTFREGASLHRFSFLFSIRSDRLLSNSYCLFEQFM